MNLSFEQGWDDIIIGATGTQPGRQGQQPTGWTLTALPIGSKLLSAGVFPNDDPPLMETVKTVPECIHKHATTLPPDEQLGGSKALILDGDWTYAVFSNYSPFSVTLATVLDAASTGAKPGQNVLVTVPVNTHFHPYNPGGQPNGDDSLGACRWRVKANDAGGTWHTYKINVIDRVFTYYQVNVKADANGAVRLVVDLESASEAGITYFIDGITAIPQGEPEPPEPTVCRGGPRKPYARTFLLLPPRDKLTIAELSTLMARILPLVLENGWTFGFSADDAGIGDLDSRTVIVLSVHPHDWDRVALLAFFEQYYPGVRVEFRDMFERSFFPVGTDDFPPQYWYVPASQRFSQAHPGIDINLDVAPWGDVERGFPVYAIARGEVYYVTSNWSGVGMCVVEHRFADVPYWVMYAHIDTDGLGFGQQVEGGQMLGRIANWTGGDGGDHLHFGVSTKPVTREFAGFSGWIDPVPFLKDVAKLDPILVEAMLTKGDTPSQPDPEPQEPTPYTLRSGNVMALHSGQPWKYWDTYWQGSGCNAIKVFSLGFALEARKLVQNRNAIISWRKHSDYEVGVDDDPVKLLDRYSVEIKAYCVAAGVTEADVLDADLVIESLNEEIPTFNVSQLQRAVAFDVGFTEAVYKRYGDAIRVCVLNGAVGNPHESEVPYLLPAARAAVAYNGFIGYHAYWAAAQGKTWITTNWDYHAGRWMRWDDEFRASGVFPRYLLSEGGICYAPDGVTFNPGLGWQSCGDFPNYLGQMDTFVSLVKAWNGQHANRATALTVFHYGNWGWENFNLLEGNIPLMLTRSAVWR